MCLVRHLADLCYSRAAHGSNVTRSNAKPHDTIQERGGNVQLCRPGGGGFARGCDRTAVSVSSSASSKSNVGLKVVVW